MWREIVFLILFIQQFNKSEAIASRNDECVNIKMRVKSYGNEISWKFGSCHSPVGGYHDNLEYESKCCQPSGTYQLQCLDSAGDGWHGASIQIGEDAYCNDFSHGYTKKLQIQHKAGNSHIWGKATDCVWGSWSSPSACSVSCGGGVRTRRRSIERQARYGGKICQGGNTKKESCNKRKCPPEAFSCYRTDDFKGRTGSTVTYKACTVSTPGMTPDSGLFIAKVKGLYVFTFHGSVIAKKSSPSCGYQLQLTKNGVKFATTTNSNYNGYLHDHVTTSMTGLTNLNVGDRVAVKVLYEGDKNGRATNNCCLGIKSDVKSTYYENFGGAWSAQFMGYLL